LIPGCTDTEENLRPVAELAQQPGAATEISILPYNPAAGAKHKAIGPDYPLEALDCPEQTEQDTLQIFSSARLGAEIAG
jgi:pyruvate-formate lyase-activating enzyme